MKRKLSEVLKDIDYVLIYFCLRANRPKELKRAIQIDKILDKKVCNLLHVAGI